MTLDMDYLKQKPTSDKMGVLAWSLVKSVLSTVIVMGAVYSIAYSYPLLSRDALPYALIFIAASLVTYVAGIYTNYTITRDTLLDESILEIDSALFYLVAWALGIVSMGIPLFAPALIEWMGVFGLVVIISTVYLVGDYFPESIAKRCVAGVGLGIVLTTIIKLIGIFAMLLIDSYGVVFVVSAGIIEVAFLSWYLYNDAKMFIESNKLHDQKRLEYEKKCEEERENTIKNYRSDPGAGTAYEDRQRSPADHCRQTPENRG